MGKNPNENAVGSVDYQQNVFLGLFPGSAAASAPNAPHALHYFRIWEGTTRSKNASCSRERPEGCRSRRQPVAPWSAPANAADELSAPQRTTSPVSIFGQCLTVLYFRSMLGSL
jgi:hypothetical protein